MSDGSATKSAAELPAHVMIMSGKIFINGEYVDDIPQLFPSPSRWTRFRRYLARLIDP